MLHSHSSPAPTQQSEATATRANSVILFAGPRGAGKSTAIASISDFPPVAAAIVGGDDPARSAADAHDTIVMGQATLPEGEVVQLCSIPDWDIAFGRSMFGLPVCGLVLLIDGRARDLLPTFERFLDRYAVLCRAGALVVGVTRTAPDENERIARRLRRCARRRQRLLPIYEVDARDRVQMLVLLAALIEMVRWRAPGFGAG
ncbi:MAG: hypothetical protein JSS28_11945 [Proteobacteria bacterium]|nr:hypothetical protein [Pseudomonadota bacterium]